MSRTIPKGIPPMEDDSHGGITPERALWRAVMHMMRWDIENSRLYRQRSALHEVESAWFEHVCEMAGYDVDACRQGFRLYIPAMELAYAEKHKKRMAAVA